MLIVKLDYGFRLNLYLGFYMYVVDFDIEPEIGRNRALKGKIW